MTVGLLIWLLHREPGPYEWWVSPEKGHCYRAGGKKRMDPEIGNQPWKVALLRQKRGGLAGSARIHDDKNYGNH